jgi:hypothetical protein
LGANQLLIFIFYAFGSIRQGRYQQRKKELTIQFRIMKLNQQIKTILPLAAAMGSLALTATSASAATTIVDTTFTVNTIIAGDTDSYVRSDVTWTIDPLVTVTWNNARLFIFEDKTFTLAGGGSLVATMDNTYAGITLGDVIIKDGSTYEFTIATTPIWPRDTLSPDGSITLDGLGSTFIAGGTYNATSGELESSAFATNGNKSALINVIGGTLQVTALTGGFTQLTVVPEPSSAALLGLGGLALILRRRK